MSPIAEYAVLVARRNRCAMAIMQSGRVIRNKVAQRWVREGWYSHRDIVAIVRP